MSARRRSRSSRALGWLIHKGVQMSKFLWWVISSVLTILVKVVALCLTPVFVLVKGVFAYAHEWSNAIIEYITDGPSDQER